MSVHGPRTGEGLAGTTTSETVSGLARDARKAITGEATGWEVEEVLRRIDRMAAEWRSVPHAPIHGWLKTLRRQVEHA